MIVCVRRKAIARASPLSSSTRAARAVPGSAPASLGRRPRFDCASMRSIGRRGRAANAGPATRLAAAHRSNWRRFMVAKASRASVAGQDAAGAASGTTISLQGTARHQESAGGGLEVGRGHRRIIGELALDHRGDAGIGLDARRDCRSTRHCRCAGAGWPRPAAGGRAPSRRRRSGMVAQVGGDPFGVAQEAGQRFGARLDPAAEHAVAGIGFGRVVRRLRAVGRALLLADLLDQAELEDRREQVQRPRPAGIVEEALGRPGDVGEALVGAAAMGRAGPARPCPPGSGSGRSAPAPRRAAAARRRSPRSAGSPPRRRRRRR